MFVCGFDPDDGGYIVISGYQKNIMRISATSFDPKYKHEPECDGWKWVKPETFPQWWITLSVNVFVRRDSATKIVTVGRDGREYRLRSADRQNSFEEESCQGMKKRT